MLLLLIASAFAPSCLSCGHPLRMHVRHRGRRRNDWAGMSFSCAGSSGSEPENETCGCIGYAAGDTR